MRRTVRLATGVAALSVIGLAGAPAALAQSVDCAVYPDACVTTDIVEDRTPPADPPPADRTPGDSDQDEASSTEARTLPFTGDEVGLAALVGAGALAAGTALVVVGRKRKSV